MYVGHVSLHGTAFCQKITNLLFLFVSRFLALENEKGETGWQVCTVDEQRTRSFLRTLGTSRVQTVETL